VYVCCLGWVTTVIHFAHLNLQIVFCVDYIMNRWKQIIELAMQCNYGQIRVVAPGRYKFITLPVCRGVTSNGRREDGKARRIVQITAFNPFQPNNATWCHTFHLSLICMSFAPWFQ
jgi:hypothetical protein